MDIDKTNNRPIHFYSSIDYSRLFERASSLNVLLHICYRPFHKFRKIFFHAYFSLSLFSFQNNHAPPLEYSIPNVCCYCRSNDRFFFFSLSFFFLPSFRPPFPLFRTAKEVNEGGGRKISLLFWENKSFFFLLLLSQCTLLQMPRNSRWIISKAWKCVFTPFFPFFVIRVFFEQAWHFLSFFPLSFFLFFK